MSKSYIVAKKFDNGQSLVWRYLTRNRDVVESRISWNTHSGTCSFWWDNWLGDGPLAKYCTNTSSLNNIKVSYFLESGHWKEKEIRLHAPPLLIPIILSTRKVGLTLLIGYLLKMVTSPISSAWENIRKK